MSEALKDNMVFRYTFEGFLVYQDLRDKEFIVLKDNVDEVILYRCYGEDEAIEFIYDTILEGEDF